MTEWKSLITRLTVGLTAVAVIAGLGGLGGTIVGAIAALLLLDVLGLALSPFALIATCLLLGLGSSAVWGLAVLVQHWPRTAAARLG